MRRRIVPRHRIDICASAYIGWLVSALFAGPGISNTSDFCHGRSPSRSAPLPRGEGSTAYSGAVVAHRNTRNTLRRFGATGAVMSLLQLAKVRERGLCECSTRATTSPRQPSSITSAWRLLALRCSNLARSRPNEPIGRRGSQTTAALKLLLDHRRYRLHQ